MTPGMFVGTPVAVRRVVVALVYAAIVAPAATGEPVIYVRAAAEGRSDGSSWDDAFTELHEALALVESPGVVWVAAGIYVPGRSRTDTFRLESGVEVVGGFAGWENPASFDLADRDFAANETVLTGEIGSETGSDNTFHVLTCEAVDATAVLDGFTIAGGRANGLTAQRQDVGGGLLNLDAAPTLRHCTFIGNRAGSRGGAIHNRGGHLTLIDCRFFGNATTVTQSASNVGGAIYSGADPGRSASVTLINCLMSGNQAGVGGGGTGGAVYSNAGGSSTLINSTLANNTADDNGGGVYGDASLVNSVLWGNRDRAGTGLTSQVTGGEATMAYSCVQGWTEAVGGVGNTGDDPVFVDPLGADGAAGTTDDDLHLSAGSPGVDVGDNDAVTVATDLDGDPRITNDRVDLGAYERCGASADCDDGDACTTDRCDDVSGRCLYEALVCDDGAFCNGAEACSEGVCLPGGPPDCDDGVDCTVDSCDPASDTCEHRPDDSICDDGTPCVQAGYCDPLLGCRGDGVVDCDDGIVCTSDACEPATEDCTHTPQSSLCDNGRYCDGAETCDVTRGCVGGTPVLCDDGIDCTVDTCDEAADQCAFRPNDSMCDNAAFCDGAERCDTLAGCVPIGAVDCDDGVACTEDTCDEDADVCRHASLDPPCDDGLFCNGPETCDAGLGCLAGEPPCALPLVCDESASACVGCVVDADCPADDPCRAAHCVDGTCLVEAIDGCCVGDEECDDTNACTTDSCMNNVCEHASVEDGSPCEDALFCNGPETCLDGACVEGSPPCTGSETCDESDDTCEPAAGCVGAIECDDGNACTDDRCVEGDCQNEPNTTACDDSDECTSDDRCASGQCSGTPAPGCGVVTPPPPVTDADGDGVDDAADQCPTTAAGDPVDGAGCACVQLDDDADGTSNCDDECPDDASKAAPGVCGCGAPDTDTDDDGTPDCEDDCPDDPDKTEPLRCGCGVPDIDTDEDGVPDCTDLCTESVLGEPVDSTGCPIEVAPGQTLPGNDVSLGRPAGCGVCGALGMVTWALLLAGIAGLRAGYGGRRHAEAHRRGAFQ